MPDPLIQVGNFEIKLIFSPKQLFYKEIRLGVTLIRFYLVAIDQDSNIHYRRLVGRQISVTRQVHPEIDQESEAARDPIEMNVDRVLTERTSGRNIHDFFRKWEKIQVEYKEGEDPFAE